MSTIPGEPVEDFLKDEVMEAFGQTKNFDLLPLTASIY